jgi:hypothetical protein
VRGEYRRDSSHGALGGFFASGMGANGEKVLVPSQQLFIASVIISFER